MTTQRDVDHATAASASDEVLLSGNTTSPPLGSAAESVSHNASGIQVSNVLPQLWSAVSQVCVFVDRVKFSGNVFFAVTSPLQILLSVLRNRIRKCLSRQPSRENEGRKFESVPDENLFAFPDSLDHFQQFFFMKLSGIKKKAAEMQMQVNFGQNN